MAKTSGLVIFATISVLLILGVLVYAVAFKPAAPVVVQNPATASGGNTNNPSLEILGTNGVTNAAVTLSSIDYVVTSPSGTKMKATNVTYAGTAGDNVIVLADSTGYFAAETAINPVVNGRQSRSVALYAFANVSIVIKDDEISSSNTITQGGVGGNNLTAVSAGNTRTFKMILTGTSQKSTGKMLFTVESPASTGANISDIIVTCGGAEVTKIALPACLTAANAASKIIAFEVPAIVGASQTDCMVKIQTTATGILGSGTYLIKEYAEQKFINTENNVIEGVCDTTPAGANAMKNQDYIPTSIVMNAA